MSGRCPYCTSPSLHLLSPGRIRCRYCSAVFDESEVILPKAASPAPVEPPVPAPSIRPKVKVPLLVAAVLLCTVALGALVLVLIRR